MQTTILQWKLINIAIRHPKFVVVQKWRRLTLSSAGNNNGFSIESAFHFAEYYLSLFVAAVLIIDTLDVSSLDALSALKLCDKGLSQSAWHLDLPYSVPVSILTLHRATCIGFVMEHEELRLYSHETVQCNVLEYILIVVCWAKYPLYSRNIFVCSHRYGKILRILYGLTAPSIDICAMFLYLQ